MHQVQITDEAFRKAEELARERGYASVEDLLASLVELEAAEDEGDYDHLFTPEILTDIRKGIAELDAGEGRTLEEVERRFAAKREAWLKRRAS